MYTLAQIQTLTDTPNAGPSGYAAPGAASMTRQRADR
jgi:hypothetical protein